MPFRSAVGLLASGGLDSCILLGRLLTQGNDVQPFYVRTGVTWEEAEMNGLRRFIERLGLPSGSRVRDLVLLSLPLDDLYAGHWSLTGQSVPGENTPDEAVGLPGRNALLTIKPAVWCQMHGLTQLALATLRSNPFPDATDEFFTTLQTAYRIGLDRKIEILRPFEHLSKAEVMRLSDNYPLGDSFSCIAPVGLLHCGRCNKCAERKQAFRDANMHDTTIYA
ncbi:MAG TPA: 7-cyano-7-deazaguanine synthase [Pirellulales bacterium]|jgi:7-cyano-7-deazaguanine synthase|nr:7-cyano-7-deazaguanine synthase [Pirellulales bacterium]